MYGMFRAEPVSASGAVCLRRFEPFSTPGMGFRRKRCQAILDRAGDGAGLRRENADSKAEPLNWLILFRFRGQLASNQLKFVAANKPFPPNGVYRVEMEIIQRQQDRLLLLHFSDHKLHYAGAA